MPSEPRTARLEARIAPETLAVVKRAAKMQGRSLSDFVVEAVHSAAQNAIRDTQFVRLSLEDQDRFVDLLLNPPPLTPAMHRAREAHQRLALGSGSE